MPSGLRKTSGNHFEIYYEAPWGGVASNAAEEDIQPNQLVRMDGISIRNGVLCYSNIAAQSSKFDLELLPPPDQPPYSPGGGGGAYLASPVRSVRGLDPDPATGYYTHRQYILDISAVNIPIAGDVFTYTGGTQTEYDGTDTVDSVSGLVILTSTPVNSGGLVSSGGTLTYYDPNAGGGGGGGTAPSQSWGTAFICLIFNCGNYLCALDQYGFSYVAAVQSDASIKFQLDQTATDAPSTNWGRPTAVKVINGVAYVSNYNKATLYAYTPGVSYVIASTYTAGQFIDTIDEYLVQLNTNSATDGVQQTRINWSGPDKFTTWDPAVDRTAGFQSLTSVEDYISGFCAVDNVGYIFKREGVTQISATGVAIQPFTYTTYWNSVAGQGLIFPGTLKQYGRFVFLFTDSAGYLFYGGQFSPITDTAGAAIFGSFNQNPPLDAFPNSLITAGFSIYPFNDKVPLSEYIFIAATNSMTGNVVFWFYQTKTTTWTSITRSVFYLLQQYVETFTNPVINSIQTATVFLNYVSAGSLVSISNLPVNITYINFTYTDADGNQQIKTFIYYNFVNSPTADITTVFNVGAIDLLFRKEEIKFDRQPTIRRVVFRASGSGAMQIKVSGVDFGTIQLNGDNQTREYRTPYGIYTGKDPQLEIISSNFNGRIVKVMMAGTYADGEID